MAMNRVPGYNIYVGGILAVKNKAALARANITHVLSVLQIYQPDEIFGFFHHHCIDADDVPDENLLQHFPAAIRFIQSGLDAGGGVLVHCAMGKSRSATLCIAYLLHLQPSALSPRSALDIVRQGRPLCEPNEGFMEQLSLYHRMGCPDNVVDHPLYSRWLYHREVEESVACGRAPDIDSVLFEDEEPHKPRDTDRTTEIKCRKCRRTLATTPFIVPHELEKTPKTPAGAECAHVFLNPLSWMRPSLFPSSTETSGPNHTADGPLSGRLTCPNSSCGYNIGKFAWAGMRCSCGTWVVPAIGVARARVDIVDRINTPQGPGNLPPAALGIRMPPGMGRSDPGPGRGNL